MQSEVNLASFYDAPTHTFTQIVASLQFVVTCNPDKILNYALYLSSKNPACRRLLQSTCSWSGLFPSCYDDDLGMIIILVLLLLLLLMMNIMLMTMMRIICAAGQIARGMSADDWKLTKSVLRVSNNDDYDDYYDYDDYDDDEEDDVDDDTENNISDDACGMSAAVAQKLMQAATLIANTSNKD